MTTAIHPLTGARPEGAVLLICADAILTRRYLVELAGAGGPNRAPLATSVAQAEEMLRDWTPHVIVLDESCIESDARTIEAAGPLNPLEKLEPTVASLTEHAPVVVGDDEIKWRCRIVAGHGTILLLIKSVINSKLPEKGVALGSGVWGSARRVSPANTAPISDAAEPTRACSRALAILLKFTCRA